MDRYDFKLRRDEDAVELFRAVALKNMRAVWAMVVEIARDAGAAGGRIVVTNEEGGVVILVGVATAKSYPVSVKDAKDARAARETALRAGSSLAASSLAGSAASAREVA